MDGGKIDIGYVFPLAGHYIPHRVKLFLEQPENQKVVFNFWQNHTPAIAKKVKTGELDVGFGGCLEKDDMEFFPVANQKLVIITPKDHPLAERERIPFGTHRSYDFRGIDAELVHQDRSQHDGRNSFARARLLLFFCLRMYLLYAMCDIRDYWWMFATTCDCPRLSATVRDCPRRC